MIEGMEILYIFFEDMNIGGGVSMFVELIRVL